MVKTSLLHQPERLRAFERRLRELSLEATLGGLSLLIGDKLKIVRLLGHGASAVVCEVQRKDWRNRFAVKLFPRTEGDQEFERVKAEAHSLMELTHTNIVRVWDFDQATIQPGDLPCYWLLMELVDGESLRGWLGKPRDDTAVLRIFCQIGEGLVLAHERQVIHCDFKPENVMLTDQEVPKLVDFGLAASMAANGERGAVGTPAFMAPEAFHGSVDARSDQFSFAATAWLALNQDFPYDPRNFDPNSRGCKRPAREGLSAQIVACLRRALEPDAKHRFPTMRALLDELKAATRPSAADQPALPDQASGPSPAPASTPAPVTLRARAPTTPPFTPTPSPHQQEPPEHIGVEVRTPPRQQEPPLAPVVVEARTPTSLLHPRRSPVKWIGLAMLGGMTIAGSLAATGWPFGDWERDNLDAPPEVDVLDLATSPDTIDPSAPALDAAPVTSAPDPLLALPGPPGCAIPAVVSGRWIFVTAVESATQEELKERSGRYSLDLRVDAGRCLVHATMSKLGNDFETYKPALTDTGAIEFITARPFTGRLTGTFKPRVPWATAAYTYVLDLIVDGDDLYGHFQAKGRHHFAGLLRGGRSPRPFPPAEATRERQPCLSLCALHCREADCAASCAGPWVAPACQIP